LAVLGKDTLLDRLRKGPNTWEGEEKDSLCGTVCRGGHYLAVLGKDTVTYKAEERTLYLAG
jgi:hypothetical protein